MVNNQGRVIRIEVCTRPAIGTWEESDLTTKIVNLIARWSNVSDGENLFFATGRVLCI